MSSPGTGGKRVSGRLIVFVGLLVLALLGGGATYLLSTDRPVAGGVVALHALDAEGALVVREASHGRKFVELISVRDGVLWQALVPDYVGTDDQVAVGVAERVLIVRTLGPGGEALTAFADRKNGKVGKILMGAAVADAPGRRLTMGRRGLELYRGGDRVWRVLGLDLETGESRWELALGEGELLWVAAAGGLAAVAFADRVELIDPEIGTLVRKAVASWACPSAAGVVAVSAGTAVLLAPSEDEDLSLAIDLGDAVGTGGCGASDTTLVMAWNTSRGAKLAGVDRTTGEPRWQRDAAAGEQFESAGLAEVRGLAPGSPPLAAAVGAHVIIPFSSGERLRFDVTSVASGEVVTAMEGSATARAWREPESDRLWIHDQERGTLAVVSVTSGALAERATVIEAYPLAAHNVVPGALWLRGVNGYLLVDAGTLAVRRAVGQAPTIAPAASSASPATPASPAAP